MRATRRVRCAAPKTGDVAYDDDSLLARPVQRTYRPPAVTDSTRTATPGAAPSLYDSPWPAEDGGPQRRLIPRAPGLRLRPGERLRVTSRPAFMANMPVLRAPGEVYVQGNSPPADDSTSWVERVDPITL